MHSQDSWIMLSVTGRLKLRVKNSVYTQREVSCVPATPHPTQLPSTAGTLNRHCSFSLHLILGL